MPEAPNPNKPTPVDETFVVDPFVLSESQDFPLEFVVSGKSKDIELPNDRVISVFPGEEATLTNLDDPSHSLTLNITGSFHETTLEDGSVLTEFNGRNLLADPFIDDGEPGFVLAIGHFSIIVDAAGNLVQPDVITGVAAWIEATNFKGHMHYYFEEGTDTEANASYCIAEMMRDPDIGQEACYSGRSFVEKIRFHRHSSACASRIAR
jgi:hypothetical protein